MAAKTKKTKKTTTKKSSQKKPKVQLARTSRDIVAYNSATRSYYTMGGVVVAMGLLVLGFQGLKSSHTTNEGTERSLASENHTAPVKVGPTSEYTGPLASEFKEALSMSATKRLDFWSSYLEKNIEGRGKVASLVGTEKIDDIVPLVPTEYNCTTYVETVAALAKSRNPQEFVKNLVSIRYRDGEIGYFNRNHFPEADWIPNNLKAENIADITNDIAQKFGMAAKTETKTIDRGRWFSKQTDSTQVVRTPASNQKSWSAPVDAKVTYIDIRNVKKVMKEIPTGTVLNLVHKDDGQHPVLITHQGFVIQDGDRVLLRHASIGGRIRTNELASYLEGLLHQQKKNTKWPLIGVNLNQINVSTSDTSRLSASR